MNHTLSKTNACGLDFGTSNSSIGFLSKGEPVLTGFGSKAYIPSAIFFDHDIPAPLFGNEGIERYVDGREGRMIWSPKNALGTGLIAEKTRIRDRSVSFKDIIGLIIGNLKKQCEIESGAELTSVVSGRPVFFNDDDTELDRLAQDALAEVLQLAGFKNIEFEYEPIAAAVHYERNIQSEQIALIVDMGGGTSDFTVAKLSPQKRGPARDRKNSILAVGGVHLAGTDFDRRLSLQALMPHLGMGSKYKSMEGPWLPVPPTIYYDLATWHKIGFVYTHQNLAYVKSKIFSADCPEKFERLAYVLRYRFGHFLARLVEKAKVELSDDQNALLSTSDIKPSIRVDVTREMFEAAIDEQVEKIATTIESTIANAGVSPASIEAIFMTGGSSLIPVVRRAIVALVPNAQLVEGDKFGSVATGLTLLAQEKFS